MRRKSVVRASNKRHQPPREMILKILSVYGEPNVVSCFQICEPFCLALAMLSRLVVVRSAAAPFALLLLFFLRIFAASAHSTLLLGTSSSSILCILPSRTALVMLLICLSSCACGYLPKDLSDLLTMRSFGAPSPLGFASEPKASPLSTLAKRSICFLPSYHTYEPNDTR